MERKLFWAAQKAFMKSTPRTRKKSCAYLRKNALPRTSLATTTTTTTTTTTLTFVFLLFADHFQSPKQNAAFEKVKRKLS